MDTKYFVILKEYGKKFNTAIIKYYKCKCRCGKIFHSEKSKIDKGIRISCGRGKCNKHVLNMIDKKFGRLTVINHHSREMGYLCKCDCGKETIARTYALKKGTHLSCGCLMIEKVAKRGYLGYGICETNNIFRNYKQGAKRRKYSFNLTKKLFSELIHKPCFYCGTENSIVYNSLRTIIKDKPFAYNGIDRIDNFIGYEPNNCVPCCRYCNVSKSTLSLKDWIKWIKTVSKNIDNIKINY